MKNQYKHFIGQKVDVEMDYPLGSRHKQKGFIFTVNYGFVPNTMSGDGEEIDAYILGVHEPLKKFSGRVIAVLHRIEDNDDKLIVVPDGMHFSDDQIRALTEFQEKWFLSEIIR